MALGLHQPSKEWVAAALSVQPMARVRASPLAPAVARMQGHRVFGAARAACVMALVCACAMRAMSCLPTVAAGGTPPGWRMVDRCVTGGGARAWLDVPRGGGRGCLAARLRVLCRATRG